MTAIFGVSPLDLLRLVQAHLLLSGCAVVLALAVGLPLSIWAAHDRRIGGPVLGAVSLVQTIPGLALLALFYPFLLFLGTATGIAIPALGFLPALMALALYALLPILRNGVVSIREIDPLLIEAANGLGMTARQRLLHVELPLGAPTIMAGIRTASVWTIGTATLATTIGQPSLGDLIFSGLQTEDWRRVLIGCIASAALAISVDALLAHLEAGMRERSPWRVRSGLALIVAGLCAAFVPLQAILSNPQPLAGRAITIGAKNFAEQYILARAIETRLRAAGFRTERREGLGSAVAYRALAAGDIDVYVDYSGTLWTNILGRTDTPPSTTMLPKLAAALKQRDDVTVLGGLGFENAYTFAMERARATSLGIASLDDLARVAPELRLASDLEFLDRPEWQTVDRAYRLRFRDKRAYTPTFMYRALASGSADVISAFSSDGRIAAMELVTLRDPRGALPHYDAVLLLSPHAAQDAALVAALRPLIGSISIARMRHANWMVDRDQDKRTPLVAAAYLLTP